MEGVCFGVTIRDGDAKTISMPITERDDDLAIQDSDLLDRRREPKPGSVVVVHWGKVRYAIGCTMEDTEKTERCPSLTLDRESGGRRTRDSDAGWLSSCEI